MQLPGFQHLVIMIVMDGDDDGHDKGHAEHGEEAEHEVVEGVRAVAVAAGDHQQDGGGAVGGERGQC